MSCELRSCGRDGQVLNPAAPSFGTKSQCDLPAPSIAELVQTVCERPLAFTVVGGDC
jgi:hypothetical protein